MGRYLVIVMLFLSNSSYSFAKNLDEQFQLWMNGKQDELDCFHEESDFLYCLDRNEAKQFVLTDRKGHEVYQVYWFDNGPDYSQEGLYRMRQNGKIGYASSITGEVVIHAEYDCAYPFDNGKAQVGIGCKSEKEGEHSIWVGGTWRELINPLMGYKE